ncbi:hypothetical protein BH09PAT4_BH09PAT4_00320 [soil metagenome]
MPTPNDSPTSWPPDYFAVLQDGNGEDPYYRSIRPDEQLEAFADRIGNVLARDIEYHGTIMVDAVRGATGDSDSVLCDMIVQSTDHHKALRQATRSRLDLEPR